MFGLAPGSVTVIVTFSFFALRSRRRPLELRRAFTMTVRPRRTRADPSAITRPLTVTSTTQRPVPALVQRTLNPRLRTAPIRRFRIFTRADDDPWLEEPPAGVPSTAARAFTMP